MERYSFDKAQDEAKAMQDKIENGKAANFSEAGQQIGKVDRFVESFNDNLEAVESFELEDDESVKIKFKEGEEITFKAPQELLYLGPQRGEEKNEKESGEIRKKLGMKPPAFPMWNLKFSSFSTEESFAALNKDLDMGYVFASGEIHHSKLSEFLEIDPTIRNDVPLYDQAIRKISDKNVSDKLRMNYLHNELVRWSKNRDEDIRYLTEDIYKEDPAFVKNFLDFSIRTCLTSSHSWSLGLFKILKSKPDLMQELSSPHREYSLPYLLERDIYARLVQTNDDQEKSDLKKEIDDIADSLGINIDSIRKELLASPSPREYMPKF